MGWRRQSGASAAFNACPRCNGLLVREELQDCEGSEYRVAARCMNCGDVIDPVIVERRSCATAVRRQGPRAVAYVPPIRINFLPDPEKEASEENGYCAVIPPSMG